MTLSRLTICLLTLTLLAGCATSSVFHPWPHQAQSWKQMLASGKEQAALARLARGVDSRDQLLYLQERARVAQLAGDHATSRDDFRKVIELYDSQDREALLRASSLGTGGAALLTNDNAIPYQGEDYERITVHGLQALNYWTLDQTQSAAVEFRRVTLEQQVAAQRRAREIDRARDAAEDEDINPESYNRWLADLNSAAGEVRSSIQNAWFYYLAGVFREAVGDYNNAIVDYRKALEIHPRMALLREDIERLDAKQQGRHDSDTGIVVVAYEQGLVPPKREIHLAVPTFEGYVSVAFPTYNPNDIRPPTPLRVSVNGRYADSEVLARMDAMAARALREQVPGMLLRQSLRAAAKYRAQKQANEELGPLGAFATQLYNLVSEQADLRSWLTLPANAQIARLELPPGKHVITLSGQSGSSTLEVPVTAGGITLVHAHDATGRLYASVLPQPEKQP